MLQQNVPTRPVLSVCIVNWNTVADLRVCLQSLREHPYTGGEQEVIVVDNASADGSAAMVAAEFPEAVLIANPTNENFARGTNQAVARAAGDMFLLLNPDVQISVGALDTLAATLNKPTRAERNPLAAAAPRLAYPDGRTQASIRGFPSPWNLLWDILGVARLFPNSTFGGYRLRYFNYANQGVAPQPMASCLLIRREAWEAVGPMDERFPLFFNDADWCLRIFNSFRCILYTPDATVTHGGGGTTKRVRVAATWESHRALLRFYDKHYRATTPRPLYALLTLLIILGAWARTGRWGESLGRNGGETTPESLARDLERGG